MSESQSVVACPYLGLPADADTHFSFPEPGHVCRAKARAFRISTAHQERYCLTEEYPTCPRFMSATRPLPQVPTEADEPIPLTQDQPAQELLVERLEQPDAEKLVESFGLTGPSAVERRPSPVLVVAVAVVATVAALFLVSLIRRLQRSQSA